MFECGGGRGVRSFDLVAEFDEDVDAAALGPSQLAVQRFLAFGTFDLEHVLEAFLDQVGTVQPRAGGGAKVGSPRHAARLHLDPSPATRQPGAYRGVDTIASSPPLSPMRKSYQKRKNAFTNFMPAPPRSADRRLRVHDGTPRQGRETARTTRQAAPRWPSLLLASAGLRRCR